MEIFSSTTRFALACNLSEKIIEPIQSRCAVLRYSKLTDQQVRTAACPDRATPHHTAVLTSRLRRTTAQHTGRRGARDARTRVCADADGASAARAVALLFSLTTSLPALGLHLPSPPLHSLLRVIWCAQVVKRLQEVLAMESASFNDAGLEALVFTAEGDMRQALNNAQVI
jgi:DNA polymerase III delta prime subunit